jgi:hypothetical protein
MDISSLTLTDDHSHCQICYSDLHFRGKTACQHDDICGTCHLRLRHLHNDLKCPICKATNDQVIVDSSSNPNSFAQYKETMWGNELGSGYIHREDVGMFFPTSGYYEREILPLFGFQCQECDFDPAVESELKPNVGSTGNKKPPTPLQALHDHLRTQHRHTMCTLCIDHKRDFVSRLPRMSPHQMQIHLRKGDGTTSGFKGHPVCEFCKPKRFYSLNELHEHLQKEHYKCHVCDKQGVLNQFFRNYQSMEKHFDQQHFLCNDVQCLSARFIVFDNEMSLRMHELSVHGGTSNGSTKIKLEFRTRRTGFDGSGIENQELPSDEDFNYGLDGQAFVPEELATNNTGNRNTPSANESLLHPQHLHRTAELREQAVLIRQQQQLEAVEDAYPTLQQASGSVAPLRTGWTSGSAMPRLSTNRNMVGQVTEEAFPSLAGASSKKSKLAYPALSTKQKAQTHGMAQQQFAAMASAAATSNSYQTPTSNFSSSTSASAVASINSQTNLAPDNFPALGGGGGNIGSRQNYAAANALAKKTSAKAVAPPPSMTSVSAFPSLGSNQPTKKQSAPASTPPSLSSAEHFPAPPSATNAYPSLRRHVLQSNEKQPSQKQSSNILQSSAGAAHAKATIEEMKASLGPNKFKQLKRLTKDFSESNLSPEGYVDQCAALFDRGYGDADFWSFLPSLLESCPNEDGAENALNYMQSLRRQHASRNYTASNTSTAAAAATQSTGWSGGPSRATVSAPSWGGGASAQIKMAPPASKKTMGQRQTLTAAYAVGRAPNVIPSAKTKNSWGAGTATVVAGAKAGSGALSIAAATRGPQGGTATKFMAKQQKLLKKPQQQSNNGKTNKKKEKDELRSLAFGK